MRHTFESHSSEPNFSFTCGIDGCPQTFECYSSIRSHISRRHGGSERNLPAATTDEHGTTSGDVSSINLDDETVAGSGLELSVVCPTGSDRLARSAALFLITLKEKYALTQSAIDFAVGQVNEIVTYVAEDLKASVESALREVSLETGAEVPDLVGCYEECRPFLHLETEYMQTKFYRENFSLVVSCAYSYCIQLQTRI